MQFVRNSLFMRSTTIFGVCEALGQDFGISATWFRVAFAAAVIYNLEYAVLAYFGIGALVLLSHFAYRTRSDAAVEAAPVAVKADEPVAVKTQAAKPVLAKAA